MADDNWWTEIAHRNKEQEPGARRPRPRSDLATETWARENAPAPTAGSATGSDDLPATEPSGMSLAAGNPLANPAVSLFEPPARPAAPAAAQPEPAGPPQPRPAEPVYQAVPVEAAPLHAVPAGPTPLHAVPAEPTRSTLPARASRPDDPTLTMPAVQAGPPPVASAAPPATSPAPPVAAPAPRTTTPAASPAAAPAPQVHATDDEEVPFWLLPAPPRPGAPVSTPPPLPPTGHAVQPPAPADQHSPSTQNDPTRHSPTEALPPPSRGDQGRDTVLPSRRATARDRAPDGSLEDRARSLLTSTVAAVGPLAARVRALEVSRRVRSAPPVMLAAAAAFAVGLVVVLVSVLSLGGDGDPAQSATPRASGTSAASPAPVELKTVTATASSEQDPDGGTTYVAENTLDGKLATAWNSDGGSGSGLTLTFTFDAPVDLRSVTVSNGYQKVIKSGGKSRDLFGLNSRVKKARVVTDNGAWDWTLEDAKAAQTLTKTFGTTKTLRMEIDSAYKGSLYSDVAISEVSFTAL